MAPKDKPIKKRDNTGRKRTAAQKLKEKASRGKRDPQKIRDASNKWKEENDWYRKVIICCSLDAVANVSIAEVCSSTAGGSCEWGCN